MKRRTLHWLPLVVFSALLFLVAAPGAQPAYAAPGKDEASQETNIDTCLACHATPGMTTTLPSGEVLYLTVDPQAYAESIHGSRGYACVQCHTKIEGFPHPPLSASTHREFTVERYTSCALCHAEKYDATIDSVHGAALAAGNVEAAVCSDCHGAHNIGLPEEHRQEIPHTCERCHSQIYNLYRESVHGAALMDEANPDVPTCVSCHGVHDVAGPSAGGFHINSPQICAECHENAELMEPYGIRADVFDTYVADFHGTTVKLFEGASPDQETNKPVCTDCHGVHDIRSAEDPNSAVIKANLLATCQKCHPDASTNFPASWLSHYSPSLEHSPLVFYVNLFYQVLIPLTLGGMLVFVLANAGRKIIDSRRSRSNE